MAASAGERRAGRITARPAQPAAVALSLAVLATIFGGGGAWPLLVSNSGNVSLYAHSDLNLMPTGASVNVGKPGVGSALVFSEPVAAGTVRVRDSFGVDAAGRDLSLATGKGTGKGSPGRFVLYGSESTGLSGSAAQDAVEALVVSNTEATFAGRLACANGAALGIEDAAQGSVSEGLSVRHLAKGSAVGYDGIGVSLAMVLEDQGGGSDTAGRITAKFTTAAAGSEVATMQFDVQSGTSESSPLLLEASGATVTGSLSVHPPDSPVSSSVVVAGSLSLSGGSLGNPTQDSDLAINVNSGGTTTPLIQLAASSKGVTVGDSSGTTAVAGAATVAGTLAVTGAASFAAAATFAVGAQSSAAAVTAAAAGAAVAAGTSYVTVTSGSSTDIVVLPSPVVGNVVKLYVGSNGYALQSSDPTTVAINPNTGGTGAGVGSSVSADTLVECTCVATTAWVCVGLAKASSYAPTALAEAA